MYKQGKSMVRGLAGCYEIPISLQAYDPNREAR